MSGWQDAPLAPAPTGSAVPPATTPAADTGGIKQLPLEQRNALLEDFVRKPGVKADEVLARAGELGLRITGHLDENLGKPNAHVAGASKPGGWQDAPLAPAPPPPPPADTSFGHNVAVGVKGVGLGALDALNAVDGAFNWGHGISYPVKLPNGQVVDSRTLTNPIVKTQGALERTNFGVPQTTGQQYLQSGVRGVTAAAPFAAAGPAAAIVPTLVGGGTSGLSSEAARQSGYGPVGQTVAGIVGGVVGGGAATRIPGLRSTIGPPAVSEAPTAVPPAPRGPMAAIARLTGADRTVGARLVAQRLSDDGINPYDAGRAITEAQANGTPASLADLGENTRALAASVSRQPGAARTIGKEFTKERQMGQMDRVRDAINRDLGPTTDVLAESERLMETAKKNAAPLYEKAYAAPVVSTPRLESILATPAGREALNRAKTIAANEGRDPKQLGFALDGNGDVILHPVQADLYAHHASARAALTDAQQALKSARRKAGGGGSDVGDATTRVEQAREDLRAAEAALRAAPSAGTAATVPGYTTQTLDYVKRGLDDVIESHRNDVTGKLKLDEGLSAINGVKNRLLGEVDRLNPAYGRARAAYGEPASLRGAMMDGKRAINKSASEINQRVKNLTPAEAEQYGLGYRSSLADMLEGSPDGANKVRALIGNPKRRAALQLVFGGKANLDRFVATLENEHKAFETYSAVHGGSATAARVGEDAANSDMNLLRGVGGDVAAVAHGPVGIGIRAVERSGDLLRYGAGKAGQRAREDAAALLFSTSPTEFGNTLGKLTLQSRGEVYRRQIRLRAMGGGAAAAVSQYGSQKP